MTNYPDSPMSESTSLLHAAWDRRIVRDMCDLMYVPSIFESLAEDDKGNLIGNFNDGFKPNRAFIEGKKKADKLYQEIIADAEKTKKAVSSYCQFLNEKRIGELEAELESLKAEQNEVQ
jgi:hypothetical protein